MPLRTVPLVTKEVYHVLNRGVSLIPIFKNAYDYRRFLLTFKYYQHQSPPLKFSTFLKLSRSKKEKLLSELERTKSSLVEIVAFCLMPNHYHFLLKQNTDNGIINFIRLTTNSYSKYFNTKYQRKGPLFEGRFKAVRVENNGQLLHLSRYIHLNPYSSFLVKSIKELFSYPYSSLPEYLNLNKTQISQKEVVLSYFKNQKEYQKFITDQAEYQRSLEIIKHQLLDE